MKEKYAIIRENARLYQKSRKKIKSQILDKLERILRMNRQYLSFLLRNTGKKIVIKEKGSTCRGIFTRKVIKKGQEESLYRVDKQRDNLFTQ